MGVGRRIFALLFFFFLIINKRFQIFFLPSKPLVVDWLGPFFLRLFRQSDSLIPGRPEQLKTLRGSPSRRQLSSPPLLPRTDQVDVLPTVIRVPSPRWLVLPSPVPDRNPKRTGRPVTCYSNRPSSSLMNSSVGFSVPHVDRREMDGVS